MATLNGMAATFKKIPETTHKALIAGDEVIPFAGPDGTFYYITRDELFNQLGGLTAGFVGVIDTSDTLDVDGIYIPESSGIYNNADGLVIDTADGLNLIIKNGSIYQKAVIPVPVPENKIPQWVVGAYEIGRQVLNGGSVWEATANTSQEPNGASSEWKRVVWGTTGNIFMGQVTPVSPLNADGIYIPVETGAYPNAGGIDVDVSDGFTVIVKNGESYDKIVYPVSQPLIKNSMDELRNISGDELMRLQSGFYKFVQLQGYYAGEKYDQPINYTWVPDSTANDDGGSVIQVTGVTEGRLTHEFEGEVWVKKFGVKGDGSTNDTEAFLNALSYCIGNKCIANIEGLDMVLTQTVIIDGKVTIKGDVRNTILRFNSLPSGEDAIVVTDTVSVNGFEFFGARVIGNLNATGLRLNRPGTIALSVTDSRFSNLRIESFGIGLKGAYSWCNLFDNVRFQGCAKPLELGNQFNNTEFLRCSLVSFTTKSSLTNCEGVNFTSPNLANTAGNVFSMFQSNLSLINPYVEYVDGLLAEVGGSNESYPSSLTSIGGKSTDSVVRVGLTGNRANIMLKNMSPSAKFIIDDNITGASPTKYSSSIELDSNDYVENDFLIKWDGTSPSPFNPSYGGTATSQVLNRNGYSEVTTVTGVTAGYQLSNNLVDGDPYVLIYCMRKPAGSNVTLKLGALANSSIPVSETDEDFEIRYIPFIARGTVLRLMWTLGVTIQISFLGIIKGSKFPKLSTLKSPLRYSEPPSSGSWVRGDFILNSSPTPGSAYGWLCVTSGSPGTWREVGAQAAASSDSAGAIGATYSQSEIQSVLDELRDLKGNLRSAGILRT